MVFPIPLLSLALTACSLPWPEAEQSALLPPQAISTPFFLPAQILPSSRKPSLTESPSAEVLSFAWVSWFYLSLFLCEASSASLPPSGSEFPKHRDCLPSSCFPLSLNRSRRGRRRSCCQLLAHRVTLGSGPQSLLEEEFLWNQ